MCLSQGRATGRCRRPGFLISINSVYMYKSSHVLCVTAWDSSSFTFRKPYSLSIVYVSQFDMGDFLIDGKSTGICASYYGHFLCLSTVKYLNTFSCLVMQVSVPRGVLRLQIQELL